MSTPVTKGSQSTDFPWWLIFLGLVFTFVTFVIVTNDLYSQIINVLGKGVWITIFVTLFGFASASAVGLGLAVMSLSGSLIMRQVARFYIEVIRGIPILVLLFYIAFVGAPGFVWFWNFITSPLVDAGIVEPMRMRDFSLLWRSIIALTIGYSAFIAEVFRAGIQAVDVGQIEAAKAMGLGRILRFRLIILPQAIRTILPPLGNDFVAMVKDSSLVSVLGVADITQMGKVYAAGSFRFFETYSIVAYIYLIMTITLSIGLRGLEKRMRSKWS
ncbi:MAG: amino acid ABC transporter permease [Hyphomicrobiales bacterium]|nr:amino acid ABC transporter permease [Hyphomicrobiales bacterium]